MATLQEHRQKRAQALALAILTIDDNFACYVGQQQCMPVERLRETVTGSGRQRRDHSDWKPQAAIERQSGMLAGSPRLRRIG